MLLIKFLHYYAVIWLKVQELEVVEEEELHVKVLIPIHRIMLRTQFMDYSCDFPNYCEYKMPKFLPFLHN
jgi:hypothetical protein